MRVFLVTVTLLIPSALFIVVIIQHNWAAAVSYPYQEATTEIKPAPAPPPPRAVPPPPRVVPARHDVNVPFWLRPGEPTKSRWARTRSGAVNIAMQFPGTCQDGWWPLDCADTWNDMVATSSCRVKCVYHTAVSKMTAASAKDMDALLFFGPLTGGIVHNPCKWAAVKPPGLALVLHCQESRVNYASSYDKCKQDVIDMWSTHSSESDVPATYAADVFSSVRDGYYNSWNETPVADTTAIWGSSNCNPHNARLRYVRELVRGGLKLHSYGKCDHTYDLPNDEGAESRSKLAVTSRYKFCIAFENTDEDGYASEKLFLSLATDCVPVYMGDPKVDMLVPPHSIIKVSDFGSADELLEYLNYLLSNNTAYEEYRAWKKSPDADANLVRAMALSVITLPCRLCERIAGLPQLPHAKQADIAARLGARLKCHPAFKVHRDRGHVLDASCNAGA